MGGQIYLDFLSLRHKADVLFAFSTVDVNGEKIVLGEDNLKDIRNQLFNLSARLKEFDTKSAKKLLCSLQISKLLLKYFNVFNEMNSVESSDKPESDDMNDSELQDEEDKKNGEVEKVTANVLTKQIVEKAERLTESVSDQDVIGTMLLKKSRYMHDFLTRKNRF